MFLLGIAGSVLPYFLALGMVLIYSLEAPAQKPDYAFNSDNSKRIIREHQPDSLLILSLEGPDFRVSSHEFKNCPLKKCDRKEKEKAHPQRITFSFSRVVMAGSHLLRSELVKSQLSGFCWSGLSPPCRIC